MFGALVRDHRRRLGLTQEELATLSSVSTRNLRNIEAGRIVTPRPATVRLLADALGLPDPERIRFYRAAQGGAEAVRPAPAPRCLPRPATHFGGRDAQLAGLLALVADHRDARPLVMAVDGMAGVGKTALAIEAGHRVAGRYPDGQLFLDLHGHSEQAPLPPAMALGLLLRQLGVPAHELPEELDALVARWRTELAGRRVLIVLDNAAGTAQIGPLLPGLSASLVLVTSRSRLAGLESDEQVTLDPLDDAAAVSLLARVAGAGRWDAGDGEAADVARLCGNLPLALRLTAARLRHRPAWTIADLADRLRTARPAAVEVTAEGTSVAAALALSHQQLPGPARELLRLLGLYPGGDLDEWAAAALLDTRPAAAAAVLDELVDVHLIQDAGGGRYRLHDLVRDYARRLSAGVDPRWAATRLVEYYLHTMVGDLPDGTVIDGLHMPDWGPPSPHRREFGCEGERIRWEEAEWRNVLATAELAETLGMDRHVCLLTRAVWGFHWRRGNAGILIRLNETALAAAGRLGDPFLIAMAHNYLAGAHARSGQMSESRRHLHQALSQWRAAGAEAAELLSRVNLQTIELQSGRLDAVIAHGQWILDRAPDLDQDETMRRTIAINRSTALRLLGECHITAGRYAEALGYLRQATRNAGTGADGYRWALILFELGRAHARLGHRVVAPLLLRRALQYFEGSGSRIGVAEALAELGLIELGAGRLGEARRLQEDAVHRTEQAGTPQGRCFALNRLAGTLLRAGDAAGAAALHRKALAIARRIDFRYEEAVAEAGLGAALRGEEADEHRRAADRLFAEMGAVGPYHRDGEALPAGSHT